MPHIGRAISIEAPAKLNLHLQVGDRRPDGFHAIESLFVALAFGDILHFETVPQPLSLEITMHWHENLPVLAIPPEKNIVFRAVSLFRDRTGYDSGLKVTIEKRIPPGGGMGGGSSDAAAALLALNRLASPDGCGLDEPDLAEMGTALGSDVPFFLHEHVSAAWVSGRGEQIQPLTLPESFGSLSCVLVNPGFPSDTAEAYRLLDCMRETLTEDTEVHGGHGEENLGFSDILNHLKTPCPPCPPCLREIPSWRFSNDFLPVLAASDKGLVYQHIITGLREQGAEFAGLSGSGSTCFGVFSGQDRAESAREALLKRWPFVIITFLLARSTIPCYNRK